MAFSTLRLPNRTLVLILIAAFIFRMTVMIASFQYRENTDVLRYRDWGRIAYLHGFADTYKPDHLSFGTLPNNQPPFSLYIISSMYYLQLQAAKVILSATNTAEGSLQFINGPLQNAFLRLPAMLADLAIGVVIFLLARRFSKNEKRALFASALFLFNPLVLYNSAFWGQMDSLVNILFLLGIYFLLYKKHLLSICSVVLSIFTKLSLIFLLPLYIFVFYKNRASTKPFLLQIVASSILLFLLTLPISLSPITWLVQYIQATAGGEMQNITALAFNFWWVVFKPGIELGDPKTLFTFSEINLVGSPFSDTNRLGIPLSIWAFILFFIFLLPLFYFASVKPRSLERGMKVDEFAQRAKEGEIHIARRVIEKPEKIFLLLSLASLVGFLFLPRMHERYMYPVFPLLAVYFGIANKFVWTYILLSLLNMINVYLVWHPMMLTFFPYSIMNNQNFQWIIALTTLGVGLLFYFRGLKDLRT